MGQTILGAVLFADLQADSIYDALEEQLAGALVDGALTVLEECVGAHGGRVVRKIGGEIEAFFPDVAAATAAAVQMQRRMTERASAWPVGPALRVGLASGPLIVQDDGDLFGDTVSIASRAVNLRRKQGIVISGDVALQLKAERRAECRQIPVVKGAVIEMFELPWQ